MQISRIIQNIALAAGLTAAAALSANTADKTTGEVKRLKLSPQRREALENATIQIASDPARDVFVIGDEVKVKAPLRIGAEIKVSPMVPWNSAVTVNMWNPEAAFEPYIFRHYWIIPKSCESTESYLRHENASYYGLYQDKFFNGATMRLYRKNEQNYLELIHTTKIRDYDVDEDGPRKSNRPATGTLFYKKRGTVAKPGDVYVIDKEFVELSVNVSELSAKPWGKHMKTWSTKYGLAVVDPDVQAKLDGTTHAPEGGSTASLKMVLPEGGTNGLSWQNMANVKGWPYGARLNAGKKYRCEVWLRQKGIAEGRVIVNFMPFIEKELQVTGQWQKYEFDVPNVPLGKNHTKCRIGAAGPGTLWVDNLLLYQADVEPFAYMPKFVEALQEARPSVLRSMHYNLYRYTLKGMLGHGFEEHTIWKPGGAGGAGKAHGMGLAGYLKLCKDVGADPWINVHLFSAQECLDFVEYLAGPSITPYGRRRAEDGRAKPWTDSFDRIYVELGNEPWGTLFFPMPADIFAAACNRVFTDMKKSSYYRQDKFCFVGGGRAGANSKGGYNHVVMGKGVELNGIGAFAGYFGGWDGLIVVGKSDKEFFQNQLLYVPLIEEPRLAGARQLRELVGRTPAESDNPLTICTYEYGPGYAVPNAKRPFVEESETVGKSLALGIATLDRSLLFLEYGYRGPQSYFSFAAGPNWSSHSDGIGMRPHCSWLAVKLYNLYCRGDYLETVAEQVSTINYPDKLVQDMDWRGNLREKILSGRESIPMVKCFAFREGKRYAFALYNRWLDRSRQVTLKVPYRPQKNVVFYKLTHEDPRATNRLKMNVDIVSRQRYDFAKEYTFTLPPSSAFVLVNEAQ